MQEHLCRMGTEAAAGGGAPATHTLTRGLVAGPHPVVQEWPQCQTAAGHHSLKGGPFQREIPEDYTDFQQPDAPALPCSSLSCTHRAGEETPPAGPMSRAVRSGVSPRQHSPETMRNTPNEWDACRTCEVWLVLQKLINLSIHQNLINHTLQLQQRNSPKMSWFPELN